MSPPDIPVISAIALPELTGGGPTLAALAAVAPLVAVGAMVAAREHEACTNA